ncbi:MAG: hypothetical protein IPG04_10465 [Polyangiaceae bacterium]|nr:hypothetical protein [Polyangiaceae bacterium]
MLAAASHTEPEWCEEALVGLLGIASRTLRKDGRPVFGLRLHQFISKGDTVHASIEGRASASSPCEAQHVRAGQRSLEGPVAARVLS